MNIEHIITCLLNKIEVCKKYQASLSEKEGKEWFSGKIVAYQEVHDMIMKEKNKQGTASKP